MTAWRALVPIKAAPDRKTRLARHLSPDERAALSDTMLWHVLNVLQQADAVADVTLLSMGPIAGWNGPRITDGGQGLNAELQAAAALQGGGPLLVIHADLPLLAGGDIAALIDAGHKGVGLAPDRHGRGTNAIALGQPDGYVFAFGQDSLEHHRHQRPAITTIVDRPGLGLDIDVAEDLAVLAARQEETRTDASARVR